MLAVLEEFKSATNESFFVANPLQSQRNGGTNLSLAGYQAPPPEIQPIVSNVQQIVPEQPPVVPVNTNSTITTRENFVKNTASEQTTFNSKMLSTYRGADNMKLKIIDQSVLKTYSNSHNTTMNVKA